MWKIPHLNRPDSCKLFSLQAEQLAFRLHSDQSMTTFLLLAAILSSDPAVSRAVAMLDRPVTVPIVVVQVRSSLGGARVPAAWVEPNRSRILVLAYGKPYNDAKKGNATKLAAVIAHELFHIEHGMNEGPAYDEQIRVLKQLGASAKDIHHVETIKAKVTKN